VGKRTDKTAPDRRQEQPQRTVFASCGKINRKIRRARSSLRGDIKTAVTIGPIATQIAESAMQTTPLCYTMSDFETTRRAIGST